MRFYDQPLTAPQFMHSWLAPNGPPWAETAAGRRLPFANLLEKRRTQWALDAKGMKECVWLKPKLVAQIEFTE